MKKLLLSFALLVAMASAHAGMTWVAIAVSPAQFEKLSKSEELLVESLLEGKEKSLDLDKAWHGIHYLLTGKVWQTSVGAGMAILGGKEFGAELGYGRARYLTAPQVRSIAVGLAKVSASTLSDRYKAQDMEAAQIYPTGIWVREGPEALKYLLNYYKPLQEFYRQAAEKGYVVVFAIT